MMEHSARRKTIESAVRASCTCDLAVAASRCVRRGLRKERLMWMPDFVAVCCREGPRPGAVECASKGHLADVRCVFVTASTPRCVSCCRRRLGCSEDVADCPWHFWMLAWYGQQGERFVAVRRRCIRMPFVPPCLMYDLSILQKRRATNGCVHQKFGKRYERVDVALRAVRPKNGAARFAVLPSVELQAAHAVPRPYLKSHEIKARGKTGPRKG